MLILFERYHYFFATRYWLSSDCIPLLCPPPLLGKHIVFVISVRHKSLYLQLVLHFKSEYLNTFVCILITISRFTYHYGRGDQTVFEGDISLTPLFHMTNKSLYQYLMLYSKYILRYNNIQLLTGFEDNICFI